MSADSSTFVVGFIFGKDLGRIAVGSARVYTLNPTKSSYTQFGSDLFGEGANEQFGTSVSISANGSTLVIAAPFYAINGKGITGRVHVYKIDQAGTAYKKFGSAIDGTEVNEQFGLSVSMSADGSTFVVGAPGRENAIGPNAGAVRVYTLNPAGTDYMQFGAEFVGDAGFSLGYSVSI